MAVIFIFSTSTFSGRETGSVLEGVVGLFWPGYSHQALGLVNYFIRKSAHIVVYGVLAFLWYRALSNGARIGRRGALLVTLLIAMAFAASDEAHQLLVPGRTAKVSDAVLDSCGASIVLLGLESRLKIKAPST